MCLQVVFIPILNSITTDNDLHHTGLNFLFTAPKGAKIKILITSVRSDYGGAEPVHMGQEIQMVAF